MGGLGIFTDKDQQSIFLGFEFQESVSFWLLVVKVEFDMKYHILQVFKTSIEFIRKSSYHFKDIYKLKLLTSFDANMTSFLKGVPNYVLNL